MKPGIETVLNELAERLQAAAPTLADRYAGQQLGRGVPMLRAAAAALDGAADWRIREIGQLRDLFAGAAPQVDQAPLADTLARQADAPIDDWTISALDGRLDTMRRALIALHHWAENTPLPAGAAIEADIWQALVRGTDHRRLAMGRQAPAHRGP